MGIIPDHRHPERARHSCPMPLEWIIFNISNSRTMKFITLIFTTICFLAFAEVQTVMGNEPAFPIVVESGDDPPDCTQAYTYEHIEILSTGAVWHPNIKAAAARLSPSQFTSNEEHNVFGYRSTVAAGGVGRLQRNKISGVSDTTRSQQGWSI